MAVISLPFPYLERLTRAGREEILKRFPMMGSAIERLTEDHVDIEVFPDRPDQFSTEGVARAMRGFLGIETGLSTYPVTPSGISFSVDPGLASIRPVLGSAVVRGLSFDDESIQSIMSLQEALHWAVGRGRAKVAIGIHDLARITPPFRYIAAPRDYRFVPLDMTDEMTMEEILDQHPKGRAYAHLVRHLPRFPLILDADDQVLSFPPIINGELTRVTTGTRDLLVDTTGTDRRAVMTAVAILTTALAEAGGTLESVTIDGVECPDLAPRTRVVSTAACNRLLGLSLSPAEVATLLRRMRFDAGEADTDRVRVEVPCYRGDIMHDWDIFEDVAIAYGYENMVPATPSTFTTGRPHPVQVLARAVREVFVGLGYLEVMPDTLASEEVLFTRMQRPPDPSVLHVLHPINQENTVVRTGILPLLLGHLVFNRHRELPQRLFAVGDAVSGCTTFQKVAAVSTHIEADFSEAYACADAAMRELAVPFQVRESGDPAFLDGRRGDLIVADGEKIGVFGEVHPAVLQAFGLEQPVAAVEIDLRAVPGCRGFADTP